MTDPNAYLATAAPERRSRTHADARPDANGGSGSSTRHARLQPHPALVRAAEERARSLQNRIADAITSYAGSMLFVYVHLALFAAWMIWFERSPWPTLTLAVSLEAIFLSTFVMISQNRSDEKRSALASHAWQAVQLEEKQNEELLNLSQQILALTDEIHKLTIAKAGGQPLAGRPPASRDPVSRSSMP